MARDAAPRVVCFFSGYLARVLFLSLALVAVPLASTAATPVVVNSFNQLIKAVKSANEKARNLPCANTSGACLGELVSVRLNTSITLLRPLLGLESSANLKIVGACGPDRNIKCIVDGGGQFPVFPPKRWYNPLVSGGKWAQLELRNLIIQHAKGGVLNNVWANVVADGVVFQENSGGVVLSGGVAGGFPPLTFTGCVFVNNEGGVFKIGSQRFGLAANGTGLTVNMSTFDLNTSDKPGAALSISGMGTSVFENVDFLESRSPGNGGAVFLDSTTALFRYVRFSTNRATINRGGAVAGQTSRYNGLYVGFRNCTFPSNSAFNFNTTDNLFFNSSGSNRMRIYFCDIPLPTGSVFVKGQPKDVVTTVEGRRLSRYFCG